MKLQAYNIVRAFLHGFTGAGLFRRLDYPGAPTEFIDSRPLEDILASGEFERTCEEFGFGAQKNDCGRQQEAKQR